MRYAIISDIHSNLEALEAVLETLSKEQIEKFYCIGDIVGYGADPGLCIKRVKEKSMITVLGNHDAGCTGFTDLSYFNEDARTAVAWTRGMLQDIDLEYLKKLELVIRNSDITLVHGTLVSPKEFDYMFDALQARKSFNEMTTNLLFVGHSHVPGIFEQRNGNVKYFHKDNTKISKKCKYIVNAGSVGQPRDGDNRACYVIYDAQKSEISINRVEYDIEKAQRKILQAGLPSTLAQRLAVGA